MKTVQKCSDDRVEDEHNCAHHRSEMGVELVVKRPYIAESLLQDLCVEEINALPPLMRGVLLVREKEVKPLIRWVNLR